MDKAGMLAALERAIRGEEEARSYYQSAGETSLDPGGARMFRELAEFEEHHRKSLVALRASLEAGDTWIPYREREMPSAEGQGRPSPGDHAGALDALRIAVQAEERASAEYRHLARETSDRLGKQMFERLAAEEDLHRKLLDDQYYALANRGIWLWGD